MGHIHSKRSVVAQPMPPSLSNSPFLQRDGQRITTTQQVLFTPRRGTDPNIAEPNPQRKKSLISQGDNQIEIIRHLHFAIREDPHNGVLLNKLGKIQYSLGQKKEALKNLRKAAVLKQCDFEGYSILAQIYEKEKRIIEAIDSLLGALDQRPDSFEVLAHLAFLYTNMANFDRGLIYGVVALKNGRSAELFNTLGRCYYGKAKGEEAMLELAQNHYISAIQENPSFVQAYNNLGNVYRAKGDLKNAMNMYQNAIEKTRHSKSREYFIAHLNLGATLIERNRLVEGIQHINIAQQKSFPQIDDILRRSGMILLFQHPKIETALRYLMNNESVLALDQLHECQSTCHGNPFHHFLRAKAYEDLGFETHAQKYYQNIISIAQQEKKLKQAQFCNKIITEAERCLTKYRDNSASEDGEIALQMMQEESHTPRRLSLAHNYVSKTKKMSTVQKIKQDSLKEALQKQVMATLPTDETLEIKNSNIHKRSSSDDIRLYMLKYASPQKPIKGEYPGKEKMKRMNANAQELQKYELLVRRNQEEKEDDIGKSPYQIKNSRTWLKVKGVGADITEAQSAVFGLILEDDNDI